MERNTVTTFGELKNGDRFYKANDKNKIVWEVYMDNRAKRDRDVYGSLLRADTEVIYLRNKEASPKGL